jgi:hypothetical protein
MVAEQDDWVALATKLCLKNLYGYLTTVESLTEKIPSTKLQITNNTQIRISKNSNIW